MALSQAEQCVYWIVVLIGVVAEPQFTVRLAQYGSSQYLNAVSRDAMRFLYPTTSDADRSYLVDVAGDAP